MSDNHKLQLEIEANAGDARREIASVGDAAAQMAQKVQQAGAQAGQGMDAAGKAGEQAAEKFTRAERSIASAIQRTTAEMRSLGQGGSAKFEELISIRGYDPAKFRGLIGDLRLAEQQAEALARANARTGLSAKEMAFAMRGVPAQFTDIFTSIASGQRPLTVLLQQGGQLKDMFGGVGNAAKAMGGYLVRLINPYTLLTAAAGGLAVAYYQGSKEADAYAKSLILTGNAAGTSTNALAGMASQIKATGAATQGAAAEALALAAGTGKISGENIKLVADAALRMQKVAGVAVKETVDQFAELGKAPVAASLKLNETTNHLTESIFRQIKALEEQGMTVEAAALAQKAYADALTSRAGEIEQNLGYIEKLWKGVASEAKSAWDAMLGVGRKQTLQDRIKELETAQGRGFFTAHRTTEQDAELAALKAQVKAQDDAAAAKARANEQEKAGIALLQERDKYLSKEEQKQRELLKLTAQYEKSAQTGQNQKDYLAAVAGVMDKFTEKTKEAKAGIKAVKDEYAELMNKLTAQDSGLSSSFWKDLDTLHKQYLKTGDIDAYRRAVELLVTQQKFHQDAVKASAAAEAEWAKAANNALKEREKEIESLEKKARATEDEIRYYGLAKSEIESLIIARLEERRAIAAGIDGQEDVVAGIDREIEARRRLRDSYLSREILDANKKAAAESAKAWENFTRDIEQSLTDALMRSFEDGEDAGKAFVKTIENAIKTAAVKFAVQMVLTPVMGGLGQALGYTQGGQGAGGFASLLGGGSGGGMGGIGNIFSLGNNLFGGGSGLYGSFATSGLGQALGLSTTTGIGAAAGSALAGEAAALGIANTTTLTGLGAALPGIGIALAALSLFGGDLFGGKEKPPEINIANVPKGTKWAVSAGAGPFGELQMAGKHLGETEAEVQKMVDALLKPIIAADTAMAAYLTKDEIGSISGALEGWSSGEVEFENEQQIHDMVNARFAVISDTIGGWVDELADTVTGTSEEVYNALGQVLSVRNIEGAESIARELLDGVDGAFAESGESVAQTLVRLVSSLDAFNTAAEGLGWTTQEMTAAWGEAASELMTAFGGRQGFTSAIAGYYERYYSDAEKLANVTRLVQEAFDDLGLAMPDTKEQFRALVESFDPMTEAGREAVSGLLKVEEAFTRVAAGAESAAADIARSAAAERRDFVAARRAQQEADRLAAVPSFAGTAGEYNYQLAMEQVRAGNLGVTQSGEFAQYVRNELTSGMSKALADSLHDALGFAVTQTIGDRYSSPLDQAASRYSMALSGRDIDAYKDAMDDLGRAFARGVIGAQDYEQGLSAINGWFADTIPVVDDLAAQMQRVEGSARSLGYAGLSEIGNWFGQIGEAAKKLAEEAAAAAEPIALATDAIARMGGIASGLGRGAAAAYYGFSEGGAEGRAMLDGSMGQIRTGSVISLAAGIASSILTTADAAKAAAQLSDQFTNKRDASLLLDGLREYDTASFEKAFTRINDAFIKGRLDEDQYAELFDIAVKTFEGPNTEAERLAQNFYDLSQAAGSLADALRVGKDTTYMNPAQRFAEAARQYLEDLAGARGGSMESMRELERSSRVYLGAAQDNAHDITEYRLASARAIAAIGGIARQGATIDDLIAEQQATREELKSLRAALEAGQALGVKQARRTADTLEKWDVTGMPA